MRKLFVALLILSVMGGAFAQEGTWGTLTGEVELSTKIDFFGEPWGSSDRDKWEARMAGEVGTLEFNIEYTKEIGPFSLTMPLRLKNGVFGTDVDDDGNTTANLAYTNGALKVEIPFSFDFTTGTPVAATPGKKYVTNQFYIEELRAAIGKYDADAASPLMQNAQAWAKNDGTAAVPTVNTIGNITGFTAALNDIVEILSEALGLDEPYTEADVIAKLGKTYYLTGVSSLASLPVQALHANILVDNWTDPFEPAQYVTTLDKDYDGPAYPYDPYVYAETTNAGSAPSGQNFVGIVPMAKGSADLNVEYDDETFGFIFGVKDIFVSPKIGDVGGYYHFMGGQSQLYVSRGAYETKWWRASDYVLNPSLDFIGVHKTDAGAALATNYSIYKNVDFAFERGNIINPDGWVYDLQNFHWENIESNGIAYRFFVLPEVLNIGIAISADTLTPAVGAGSVGQGAWAPPFYNRKWNGWDTAPGTAPKTHSGKEGLFGSDFLLQTVFGAAYEDGPLAVSFMLGLADQGVHYKDDDDDQGVRLIDIPLALGASFEVMEGLKVRGDISAYFYGDKEDYLQRGKNNDADDPDDVWYNKAPNFNLGAVVTYDSDILVAGFGIKGLDVVNVNKYDGSSLGIQFMAGYNIARDGDFDFGDANDGFWAKASGFFSSVNIKGDADQDFSSFGFDLGLGYQGLELSEYLKVNVQANLSADILTSKTFNKNNEDIFNGGKAYWNDINYVWGDASKYDSDSVSKIKFSIKPELVWSVFENGTITIGYELGTTDAEVGRVLILNNGQNNIFNVNVLSATFKWSF